MAPPPPRPIPSSLSPLSRSLPPTPSLPSPLLWRRREEPGLRRWRQRPWSREEPGLLHGSPLLRAPTCRRRREGQMVDIRKAKRKEILQKRHHVGFAASASGVVPPTGHSAALQQKLLSQTGSRDYGFPHQSVERVRIGDLVFYFPQGHIEQDLLSFKKRNVLLIFTS